MRKPRPFPCLSLIVLITAALSGQAENLVSELSAVSDTDIRNSAIAFVNTSTTPGLEGATLTVDTDERYSKQWRSSLGFNAEFTLKDHIFNGYWGLAIVTGSLTDQLDLVADTGQPVNMDVKRTVTGVRGSIGLSFPVNQHFKLRPFLSMGVSDLQTRTTIKGLPPADFIDISFCEGDTQPVYCSTSAWMGSTAGTVDALYSQWLGENKLEVDARFNLIYTDSISGDNSILNTIAWSQTAQLKFRYSGPTSMVSRGRPWRWQVYVNHTNFLSQDKSSLGYTGLFEVGAGLDWQLNIKPMDWFGWQSVGISFGVIGSRNVEGYNVGLTAR